MTPYNFSIGNNGNIHYIYNFKDLREWYERGRKHGDSGMILWERNKNMLTFKCFGTIENPVKEMQMITFVHDEAFSGPMPTDKERINSTLKETFSSSRIVMMDLSNTPNIIKQFPLTPDDCFEPPPTLEL